MQIWPKDLFLILDQTFPDPLQLKVSMINLLFEFVWN